MLLVTCNHAMIYLEELKVNFARPNTTAILLSMDQNIICIFKAFFVGRVFLYAIEATWGCDPISLYTFWKNVNVKHAITYRKM